MEQDSGGSAVASSSLLGEFQAAMWSVSPVRRTIDPEMGIDDLGLDSLLLVEVLITMLDALAEIDPAGIEARALPQDLVGIRTVGDLLDRLTAIGWTTVPSHGAGREDQG